jgi:hypothetical protein
MPKSHLARLGPIAASSFSRQEYRAGGMHDAVSGSKMRLYMRNRQVRRSVDILVPRECIDPTCHSATERSTDARRLLHHASEVFLQEGFGDQGKFVTGSRPDSRSTFKSHRKSKASRASS